MIQIASRWHISRKCNGKAFVRVTIVYHEVDTIISRQLLNVQNKGIIDYRIKRRWKHGVDSATTCSTTNDSVPIIKSDRSNGPSSCRRNTNLKLFKSRN